MQQLTSRWQRGAFVWMTRRYLLPGAEEGGGYEASGDLDGHPISIIAPTPEAVQAAFDRACLRARLRRWLPWIAPPSERLVLK